MSTPPAKEPPPYTIHCDQQPFHPPNYEESMINSPPMVHWPQPEMSRAVPGPDNMGWTKKSGKLSQDVNITQPNQTSSVVYVAQHPQAVMQEIGLPGSRITCPSCREIVATRVVYSPGCQTHLWACIMLAIGLWPCCVLPYCCPPCQDANYFCENCGAYVGSLD